MRSETQDTNRYVGAGGVRNSRLASRVSRFVTGACPALAGALLACGLASGCAALTNPVAEGVSVRRLPPELLAPAKAGEQTIPLTLLGQPRPAAYRLEAGDVLGVYVEGFLGDRTPPDPLPIHVGPLVQARDQHRFPPAAGYPVTVEEDGAIYLPSAGALSVRGKTVAEAREAIHAFYVQKRLLKQDPARVIVTLLAPRQYQVLVMRQEATSFSPTNEGPAPSSKRGTGHFVDLLAYENDVLHALAQTGGLPGLDAYNEVVIQRGFFNGASNREAILRQAEGDPRTCVGGQIIHIPLRQPPGAPMPFRPEDMILQTGDVVFLEARDDELFYTGGLLPPGAFVLPRDHDMDVIEAVSRVRGPLFNGAFGGSNLSGTLIQPGIGNPSPSLLAVLRRTPGGGQVSIVVDLRDAVRHPEERLVVRAGDVLILQEKPGEALARYATQTFFNFNVLWQVVKTSNATGVIDVAAPDRLTPRLGSVNVNP
jgi:protein involved in polysaccharide export with SLBB domain